MALVPSLVPGLEAGEGGPTFGIAGALGFGFVLALGWGLFLALRERRAHHWSVEWFYCRWMERFGGSSRAAALAGRL
jgi:hypothetical protein